ncbi:MAG: hypothetical protein HYS21_08285 [Deltaproteobacteria bacterium]|nr:hypothetical protein [Deltaproteobacteria bacterium]
MPNISSETLFHFTQSCDNLKGILKNEFYPKYSLEALEFKGKNRAEFAYPMVCFCDIPLSQVKEHLKTYGNYGIGMSREWVLSKGLNPVMYLRKDSELSNWLCCVMENSTPLSAAEDSNARGIKGGILYLLRHIKPFEGISNRIGKNTLVKFYNEKEWRYVPFQNYENGKEILITSLKKDEYENVELLRKKHTELEKLKLGFAPTDIKYIIVHKENEILDMVNYLENIKLPKYDTKTIKILTSRIITSEQIKKDF